MAVYREIFFTFFRIGALTFGGGYTMLPLLQRETVEKKHWAAQEEVMDYYAVGQCLPGLIAVNTAIFIGYKVKGKAGAAAAAAGLAAPSLLVILAIASLIRNFSSLAAVQSAFAGIRVAVCALVTHAIYGMGKKAIISPVTAVLAAAAFLAAAWLGVSPVPVVIGAAGAGLALSLGSGKIRRRTGAPGQPSEEAVASDGAEAGSEASREAGTGREASESDRAGAAAGAAADEQGESGGEGP
jgi:chromate transporter